MLFTASTIRSFEQLRTQNRKVREWSFDFQRRFLGPTSSGSSLRPSETSQLVTWIKPILIMKAAVILIVFIRRYIDKWKTRATIQDWVGKGRRIVVFTMYMTFAALYIYGYALFFQDLAWFGPLVDKSSWGFGQIVAFTVWAGPLCEYFHLEIRE